MGEGRQAVLDRRPLLSRDELSLQDFAEREDPRLPRTGAGQAARLSRREELRRLVDGVGQLDPGAHREVSIPTTLVDHSALKVNQTGIIVTVLVAFVGSALFQPLLALIPLLAIVLLLGTFAPQYALFKQFYFKVLKPRGIVKPRPVQDRPQPHNFAQGMGGVVLAIASIFLIPVPVIGLALSLLVAVLAFVNVAFGYCLGCQIFYQLERRGVLKPS